MSPRRMIRYAWYVRHEAVTRWIEIAAIAIGITAVAASVGYFGSPLAGVIAGGALLVLWLMT